MKTDRQLLEEIQATQLVILSKLFDMEAQKKGTVRSPADYTREAANLVERLRSSAAEKLSSLD
jgi:hypothetical protein